MQSKDEVVAAQYQAIQDGSAEVVKGALGACVDAGKELGGVSQAEVDAKVAEALAQAKVASDQALADARAADAEALALVQAADAEALAKSQAEDAQAQADAVAVVQQKLDETVKALADMTAKDAKDSAAARSLKASIASIQAALDALIAVTAEPPADEPPSPEAA